MPLNPDQRAARGSTAERLLEDEAFKLAMEATTTAEQQRLMGARTPAEAWDALCSVRAGEHFRAILRAYLADGEKAAKEIVAARVAAPPVDVHAQYLKEAVRARAEFKESHGATADA